MSEPASKEDVVMVTCLRFVRNSGGKTLLQGLVLIDTVRTAQNQSPAQVCGGGEGRRRVGGREEKDPLPAKRRV